MTEEDERNARHRARMARKKSVVDAEITRPTEKRGVVLAQEGVEL